MEENIRYFEGVKESCELFLESLVAVPVHIVNYSDMIGQKEKSLYWQMTVGYGRRITQMQMEWAQDCIRRLEEK